MAATELILSRAYTHAGQHTNELTDNSSHWAYTLFSSILTLIPLSPRDALEHHSTSLKTDLISLQLGVLEWIFP